MKMKINKRARAVIVAALVLGMAGCKHDVTPTVNEPVFSIAGGFVEKGTEIQISCDTDDAKIYYTTDSSEPTASSTEYTTAITITTDTVIKAIAVKEGMNNSEIASATYEMEFYPGMKHMVEISDFYGRLNSFLISPTTVTYAEWYEVFLWATSDERGDKKYSFTCYGREGSEDQEFYRKELKVPTEGSRQPVVGITWRDAVVWCNAASEKEGLVPVYYYKETTNFSDKTKVCRVADLGQINDIKNGEERVEAGDGEIEYAVMNENANGYRLPIQEEWNKANPHDGTITKENLSNFAWYKENSDEKTHDVGLKKKNEYGLYDMYGNIYEWTFSHDYRDSKGNYWRYLASDDCYTTSLDSFFRISDNYIYSNMDNTGSQVDLPINSRGFRVVRTVINNQ